MAKKSTFGSGETLWVTIMNYDGNKFFVTSDKNRDNYFIYNSEYKKLGKNKDPLELERKFVGDNTK